MMLARTWPWLRATSSLACTIPSPICIEEVRHLRAPLGVYGCNGNHEIYARAEDLAEKLYQQAGMKLLRRENAVIAYKGAQLNLIGVDYQRERMPSGRKMQMLDNLEPLVRRDIPNVLLSHNPNSFNRAAELGIELTLSGHTHGGQVKVEILDVSNQPGAIHHRLHCRVISPSAADAK